MERDSHDRRMAVTLMRKSTISQPEKELAPSHEVWLDVEALARAELTSEQSGYPFESALGAGPGWRASGPGKQTIRLVFTQPQRLRRIKLQFVEPSIERTQEYVLRWSADGGRTWRDIARQQWNFSPQGSTTETEEHRVDLSNVDVLELSIVPDKSGGDACASLAQLRIA
jgi:hypothetical protein